jgi:WD40 repeat protein
MTDQDVRDFLERMATEEPVPFHDAEPLARRARRRAARTAAVGAVSVAAAIALVFASVAEIRTSRIPADDPTPSPAPGVTRENDEVLRFTGLLPDGSLRSPGALVAVDPRTGEERVLLEGLDSVYSARWSADGRWLAYETDATDGVRRDLWVAGGSQAPHVVATGGAALDADPGGYLDWKWSPTGAKLATIDGDARLRTIDVATGETKDLGAVVADLLPSASALAWPWAWSPDGTRLVFSSLPSASDGSLYSVDAQSGERSLLARLPGSIERIRWSPDGARIAVQTQVKDAGHLYVLDADGSDIRMVANDNNSLGFAWSPDGTRLAFGSEAENEVRIRVATMDGAAPAGIGTVSRDNCLRTSWGYGFECFPTWSPDGTQVAFRIEETGKVTVFDVAGPGGGEPLDELTFLGWDGGWYRARFG